MKKLLFFAIGLIFSLPLFSQSWFTDGTQWVVKPLWGDSYLTRYYVDGDTIVNNKTCKIIRRFSRYANTGNTYYKVYGVVYEKNDKVYRYMDNGDFLLIYDFNLKVGESISYPNATCGNEELTLRETGVEDFDGATLRYQAFDYRYQNQDRTIKYYEKIGIKSYPNNGGYQGFFPTKTINCTWGDPPSILVCFSNQDTNIPVEVDCNLEAGISTSTLSLFTQDLIQVYPNPTTGLLKIENLSNTHFSKLEIFNLVGQKIMEYSQIPSNEIDISHLENGIYFLNYYYKNQLLTSQKVIKSGF